MGPNPDRAPTRTGPQPGLGPKPGPGQKWYFDEIYLCGTYVETYVARVGAQSGLGPGPGWGPYGPIWALMFF